MPHSRTFKIAFLGGEFATEMSCQEAGCVAYAEGWVNVIDVSNPQLAAAATWIKQSSGRRFYEWDSAHALEEAHRLQAQGVMTVTEALKATLGSLAPGMIVFYFHPGQQCFKEHLDREVKFLHQSDRGTYEHKRPLDFNEHHNEEAYKVNTARQRG